ncbi:D-tagatose-1,6-bisphosphate aldolase subunit GatY [Vibrio thalassae]|uniref:D-tagatose-1,6-bisphosphate aldolase subunit GatY n=1 Tax=Vibrio thalassae TaxID=1243014 RepID=A0A240ELB7_9VIBR|nr:class II fructose-bisphosphate aldolase [Vibrio thalassae]SNX49492.1 D-tagatose-1,6-bisphosphate aldolase subunit GatY [Vibrio thalassae]
MLWNLNDMLPMASKSSYAVPCFNVFGYEDARAVVEAAEQMSRAVILACNKDVIEFYGVETAASIMLPLARKSSVPVCLHLDHCYEEKIVFNALNAGFSSVMFDGSQLSLDENIARSKHVVEVAKLFGASVEGEIGSVPYQEGRDHIKSIYTQPEEAARYVEDSGVDCVAVSIGNVHRLTSVSSEIDHERLDRIAELVKVPLVIHGTSGIKASDILKLKQTSVAKFNIGTCLRQAFGFGLREAMNNELSKFDRIYFMKKVMPLVTKEAIRQFQLLSKPT